MRQSAVRDALWAYTANGSVTAIADVADACDQAHGSHTASFDLYPASQGLTLPELQAACLGANAYSMWAWVRLDERAGIVPARTELVCAVHGPAASVELLVVDRRGARAQP